MILVISNIADEAAATLVDMFPPGAASLITASQFHQSFKGGISVNDFSSSKIRLNDISLPVSDIEGVITTITNFYDQEFYYIEPADREYVCAEMNAFFTWFLSELTCKKINPPSVSSFSGINMHKTVWIKTARALKIPIWPIHAVNAKSVVAGDTSGIVFFNWTIIGDVIIGETPPKAVYRYMHALQQAFSLPYLVCYFIIKDNEYYLADIVTVPDIQTHERREAIVNYFS